MKRFVLVVFLLAIQLLSIRADAQVDPGALFRPWPENAIVDFEADGTYIPGGETDERDEDIDLTIYESRGRWRVTNKHPINPTVSYDLLHVDVDTSFEGLPDRLTDHTINFDTPLGKMGDWFVAAGAGVGYAGESVYNDGNAWYGRATVVVGREFDEDRTLYFRLNYDGNRSTFPDIPFLGIAYSFRASETVRAVVGAPFNVVIWEPNQRLQILIAYQIPLSAEARVTYQVSDAFHLFGAFESRIDPFHIDALPGDRRLFLEQRRLEIGAKFEPSERAQFILAGGFAFDQEFSTGFDSRDLDKVTEISDEPYVRAGLRLSF